MRLQHSIRVLVFVLACAVAVPCVAQGVSGAGTGSAATGNTPVNQGVVNTLVALSLVLFMGLAITIANDRGAHRH